MTARNRKSPAQRAQEALDVAQRRVDLLRDQRNKAESTMKRLDSDLFRAKARLEYVKANPDLPSKHETTTP